MDKYKAMIATAPIVCEETGKEHTHSTAVEWFETIINRAKSIWEREKEKTSRFPGMIFFLLPGDSGEVMGVPEAIFPVNMRQEIVRSLSVDLGPCFVIYVAEVTFAEGSEKDLLAVNGRIQDMESARRGLYVSVDGAGLNRCRLYPFEGTEILEEFKEMPVPETSPVFNLSGQLGLN